MLSPEAFFLAHNAPQAIWWLGSARTRWESLQLTDPLAGLRGGPPEKGEMKGRKRRDGVGEEWREWWKKEKGGEGKGGGGKR